MIMRFQEKTVLITGGSRGIGAETARLFAAEGATVIITYHSDETSASELIGELGGNCAAVRVDLAVEQDIRVLFEKVRGDFGHLDVLVNNVGVTSSGDPLTFPLSEWNRIISTNLAGTFLCTQLAAPLLSKGAAVVNLSSLRGLEDHGRPPIIAYSTSKAGIISMTKTFAKALAPGVRVNCVSPGVTNTAIVETFDDALKASFIASIYLERLLEPAEIASAIAFLASDDASGITGVNLRVDGGQSLGR
jgi:3-oxoacyl-[acyl-carrier protein] reductase